MKPPTRQPSPPNKLATQRSGSLGKGARPARGTGKLDTSLALEAEAGRGNVGNNRRSRSGDGKHNFFLGFLQIPIGSKCWDFLPTFG